MLRDGGVPLRSGPELFRSPQPQPADSVEVGGRAVEVRAVAPADAFAVARFLRHVSPRSRYQRFHAASPRVTQAQIASIVDVDHVERESVLGLSGRHIVGVAQYARVSATSADLAVMVDDAWQGLGLGRLLVERVARAAAAAGLEVLEASVLSENTPALRLARHFPGTVDVRPAGTTTNVLLGLSGLRAASG